MCWKRLFALASFSLNEYSAVFVTFKPAATAIVTAFNLFIAQAQSVASKICIHLFFISSKCIMRFAPKQPSTVHLLIMHTHSHTHILPSAFQTIRFVLQHFREWFELNCLLCVCVCICMVYAVCCAVHPFQSHFSVVAAHLAGCTGTVFVFGVNEAFLRFSEYRLQFFVIIVVRRTHLVQNDAILSIRESLTRWSVVFVFFFFRHYSEILLRQFSPDGFKRISMMQSNSYWI